MTRLSWDDFNAKHSNPFGLLAGVTGSLPRGIQFDKNKRKLPTPYALFLEWSRASLKDEWTASKIRGGFIVCVATQSDARLIVDKFRAVGDWKKTPACANAIQIGYSDSGYKSLAISLGYSL